MARLRLVIGGAVGAALVAAWLSWALGQLFTNGSQAAASLPPTTTTTSVPQQPVESLPPVATTASVAGASYVRSAVARPSTAAAANDAPALPEAPLAILLPFTALVTGGVIVLVRRRAEASPVARQPAT